MSMWQVVWVLLSATVALTCYELPQYSTPIGTHYEAGFHIGRHFAERIQTFISSYATLHHTLRPFYRNNREIVDDFIHDNAILFPNYVDEMEGIARGANVSMTDIWLLNLSKEIDSIVNKEKGISEDVQCSDIFVNTHDARIIGHNEDNDKAYKEHAYLVTVNVRDGVSYTAYTYPGVLAGNAFGFNSHGIVITTNSVPPINVLKRGIARNFLNRHAYNATSTTELISFIERYKNDVASGFSINFASVGEDTLFNAEVATNASSILKMSAPTHYAHFNVYERLSVPQRDDPSSTHRMTRYKEFAFPMNADDTRKILGDNKDKAFPIYRDGTGPDTDIVTTASVIYDLKQKTLDIYLNNPKYTPVRRHYLIAA